jgi:exopolyphosphatase/guanosine-5'-triphosphate,3'-diphosphate pyrophosphatase
VKIGALDVGSNTVLMLVAEATAPATIAKIADMSRITRLGRGVDAARALDPESAARTLDTIDEFASRARELGAERILAVATAALRDARDGAKFIARVKQRTGVTLEIISGESEARLSWLAATRGLKIDPSERLLVVDIGGGSTELIRAEPGAAPNLTSLQLGSVRLTERIVRHDPPTAREAADLRLACDELLQKLGWEFAPSVMVGIAGTVTTICAVTLGLHHYDASRVHGYRLARAQVLEAIARFGAVTLEERRKMPGLEPGRADVIFAGAAILERVMEHFGLDEVIVSDQGVRWGLVWQALDQMAAAR